VAILNGYGDLKNDLSNLESGMKYKILLLCDFSRNSPNTIIDHVTSFKKYSKHDVYHINPVTRKIPDWLNLNKFDIIIIHYSIYVLGENYIDASWRDAIACSSAYKVQFIQDEYRTVFAFHARMRELKIDVLYTCIPETEIEKVYPIEKLSGFKKINNLTGYVPEYFEKRKPDFSKKRTIDVGYRGREGLWWLGSLFQEKSIIGREFLRYAQNNGIKCDISSREQDRIYGKEWLRFLDNCRCTLGTESGASVIDFTGEIEKNVKKYCKNHSKATFKEVQTLFLKDLEGKVRMNQISPRAFEAIGCGCCQILFEGEYSGILKPDIHYIPLKKDFSNISEVIQKIKDESLVKKMVLRAYEDIIATRDYSYKTFVEAVDRQIEEFILLRHCAEKTINLKVSGSAEENEDDQRELIKEQVTIPQPFKSKSGRIIYYILLKIGRAFWHILRSTIIRLLRWAKQIHPFFIKEKIRLAFYVLKNI
jgi:hypothetical protein